MMNRPDIEGMRRRIDDCNQVVYETWGTQGADAENDMESLLAYITDLERERDEAIEAHRYVLEGNACLAARVAQAEKVVEAAKGYRDARDEMQSSAAYDALYAALAEEGDDAE